MFIQATVIVINVCVCVHVRAHSVRICVISICLLPVFDVCVEPRAQIPHRTQNHSISAYLQMEARTKYLYKSSQMTS